VAVKIKLKRLGKIREPYYRIVIADARTKRDGRAIEEIGKYHPKAEPSLIEVDYERVQHWLSVGAQPTDPVRVLLKITGDWQKFTGEPGAEGTLKTAAPKADKKEAFTAAAKESLAGKEAKEGANESKAASKASKPAKSTAAKDTAAKDTAAKDGAAKDGAAKDGAAKDGAAKDRAPAAEAAVAEAKSKAPVAEGAEAEARSKAPAAAAAVADAPSEAAADAKGSDAKAADAKAAEGDSGSGA